MDRLFIGNGDHGNTGWNCFLCDEMKMQTRWRKTMMGLPNWLRGREGDFDMTHDDEVPVPEIAKVEPIIKKPLPYHIAPVEKPNDEASVVVQAHAFVEQWKLKDATQQKEIEQLRSDFKAEKRNTELLELDIAQHLNTIATLQSEVLASKEREEKYRQFLSVKKQINEKERLTYIQFEIDDPPKKERKPNAKATKVAKKETANRKEADSPAEKPTTI